MVRASYTRPDDSGKSNGILGEVQTSFVDLLKEMSSNPTTARMTASLFRASNKFSDSVLDCLPKLQITGLTTEVSEQLKPFAREFVRGVSEGFAAALSKTAEQFQSQFTQLNDTITQLNSRIAQLESTIRQMSAGYTPRGTDQPASPRASVGGDRTPPPRPKPLPGRESATPPRPGTARPGGDAPAGPRPEVPPPPPPARPSDAPALQRRIDTRTHDDIVEQNMTELGSVFAAAFRRNPSAFSPTRAIAPRLTDIINGLSLPGDQDSSNQTKQDAISIIQAMAKAPTDGGTALAEALSDIPHTRRRTAIAAIRQGLNVMSPERDPVPLETPPTPAPPLERPEATDNVDQNIDKLWNAFDLACYLAPTRSVQEIAIELQQTFSDLSDDTQRHATSIVDAIAQADPNDVETALRTALGSVPSEYRAVAVDAIIRGLGMISTQPAGADSSVGVQSTGATATREAEALTNEFVTFVTADDPSSYRERRFNAGFSQYMVQATNQEIQASHLSPEQKEMASRLVNLIAQHYNAATPESTIRDYIRDNIPASDRKVVLEVVAESLEQTLHNHQNP